MLRVTTFCFVIVAVLIAEIYNSGKRAAAKRFYSLQNAEGQQSGAKGSGSLPSQVAQTADINTVADLYLVVKQKDKNFGPETASKVVNEDGRRRCSSIRPGRTSRSSTFAKTARARATMKRRKARIYKKNPAISTIAGFLVREAGLEPARPEWTLEPESSESANSTTRASCAVSRLLRYIIT